METLIIIRRRSVPYEGIFIIKVLRPKLYQCPCIICPFRGAGCQSFPVQRVVLAERDPYPVDCSRLLPEQSRKVYCEVLPFPEVQTRICVQPDGLLADKSSEAPQLIVVAEIVVLQEIKDVVFVDADHRYVHSGQVHSPQWKQKFLVVRQDVPFKRDFHSRLQFIPR